MAIGNMNKLISVFISIFSTIPFFTRVYGCQTDGFWDDYGFIYSLDGPSAGCAIVPLVRGKENKLKTPIELTMLWF